MILTARSLEEERERERIIYITYKGSTEGTTTIGRDCTTQGKDTTTVMRRDQNERGRYHDTRSTKNKADRHEINVGSTQDQHNNRGRERWRLRVREREM